MRIRLGEPQGKPQAKRRRSAHSSRLRTIDHALTQALPSGQRWPRAERAPSRRSRSQDQAAPPAPASRAARDASPGFLRRVVLPRWWLGLILAGVAAAVVYTSTDAQFFVYEATIVGARHIDAHTVYNVAGIHEQNIFWIQPRQVAERVFQIDGVRAVRVRCALPARVIIEITEREPVVLWRSDAHQQDWWVDEEGTILPYHGDTDDPAVLFVLDTSEPSFQSGEQLRPEGVVRSVQQLAKAMQGTRLFYFGSDRGLSFTQQTQGGQWPVYVGDSLNLAHKIQVLEALTRYMESHGIWPSYVDVRWADRPVYGVPTNIGE